MPIDRRDPAARTLSRGRCHLYVLPCAYEDLLKLGFSRDPLARLQQLHPRWFEFFDLDRAFAVETESVPDARKLELAQRRLLVEHNAPMPLTVRDDAGGKREWYRGAYAQLAHAGLELRDAGHVVHAPLRGWLRHALEQRADLLFSWTSAMLDADALASPLAHVLAPTPAQRTVRDALDAYDAVGLDLAPWLPPAVLDWHRGGR
jgi:hypothetical protein